MAGYKSLLRAMLSLSGEVEAAVLEASRPPTPHAPRLLKASRDKEAAAKFRKNRKAASAARKGKR